MEVQVTKKQKPRFCRFCGKDLYRLADAGIKPKDVDNITSVINKHTNSYKERREHFDKIKHLI